MPASPIVLAVASVLVPGLGQFILGQRSKGAVLIALALCGCCGTVKTFGLGGVFLGAWNLVCAIDAYLLGQKVERGRAVGPWEWF
jgi:TM2 domain-containing membrane protein YozV